MTKKKKFSREGKKFRVNPLKRHSLSLDDATVQMALNLGDGDLSLGVRRAVGGRKYWITGYRRDTQPEFVDSPSRKERLNRRVPPRTRPTPARDPTFPPAVKSFYDRIVYLGLQQLNPAELRIAGHKFGVKSFAWQQPWGFSISCANDGASKVTVINRLVGEPQSIVCWMKFMDRTIEFDCYLKAMSFDEQKITLSFAGQQGNFRTT
jgi:hypothetical protein